MQLESAYDFLPVPSHLIYHENVLKIKHTIIKGQNILHSNREQKRRKKRN